MTPKPHSRRAEILTELGADPRAIADRVVDLEEQLEAALAALDAIRSRDPLDIGYIHFVQGTAWKALNPASEPKP